MRRLIEPGRYLTLTFKQGLREFTHTILYSQRTSEDASRFLQKNIYIYIYSV